MFSPNEQFASMNKASYENALRMASISLDKAERYAKFNLHAARVVLEQTAQTGSVVAGAKDAHDVETLRGKVSELVVQNATAYAKGLYQIASETQTEFSELAEQAWSTYAEEATAWAEKLAKNAPAGSDVALITFKSTVAATTAAFDQFSKASKQMVGFADASARVASESVESIAKASSTNTKATKNRKTA